MELVCPGCGFSRRIDPARLPEGAAKATCPKCGAKFDLPLQRAAPAADRTETGGTSPRVETPRPYLEPGPVPPRPAYTPPPLPAAARRAGIPWEEGRGGFFRDLFSTVKQVLFSPLDFFSRLPSGRGQRSPFAFAFWCGTAGLFFSFIWQGLLILAPTLAGFSGDSLSLADAIPAAVILGLAVLSPLFTIIILYIYSGLTHLFLMIVRGANGGFEATFQTVAYGWATQLLNIVPFLGGMASAVYLLILMILGLPKVHRVGTGRVLVALLVIPIGLVLLLTIIIGIIIALAVGLL
ncbi:MAG: YIP1 family protein [Pseudomonadota bacterium]